MPELGSTSRKAGTRTSEKMNESIPSMVHPPQAAQKARFWLDVSGTRVAEDSTTGLIMLERLDHLATQEIKVHAALSHVTWLKPRVPQSYWRAAASGTAITSRPNGASSEGRASTGSTVCVPAERADSNAVTRLLSAL